MFDLTGQQVLLRLVSLLLISGLGGFFVALLAVVMGDPGPKYDGRVSVNPLKHLEPVGALTMVIFRTGWLRPVVIETGKLRTGGVLLVVLGSALLMLGVAEILWLLRPTVVTSLPDSGFSRSLVQWIDITATMTVWFAVVSLIPLPPFTGGLLLAQIAPGLHALLTRRVLFTAIAAGVVVFVLGGANLLSPAIRSVADFFLR